MQPTILYWAELPEDLQEQRERWRAALSGDPRTVRVALRRLRRRGIPKPLSPRDSPKRDAGVFDAIDELGLGLAELHAGDRLAVATRIGAAHGLTSPELVGDLADYLGSGIGTKLDLRGARTVEDLAAGRSAGIDWGLSAWAHDACLSKPIWPFALDVAGESALRAMVSAQDWDEFRRLLRRKRLTERVGQAWHRRLCKPIDSWSALAEAGELFRDAHAARLKELAAGG
jgi:hypothetical protein